MKFDQKIYYCNVDDFFMDENKALDLGFIIENGMVVIPAGTRFKVISEHGPGGWPVIEVFGEELDFASEESILISLA